jgi:nicotinate phosphoribosyltransferase
MSIKKLSPLLPSFEPYTDVYFLRSVHILKKLDLNPFVRAQVFFRKGPGKIAGMEEVLELIRNRTEIFANGGQVFHLPERSEYHPEETVLLIEARAQDVISLETVILGILSAETTKLNDQHGVDLSQVTQRVKTITEHIGGRPVFYFGARHWRYDEDVAISAAAFAGGITGASTMIGAQTTGKTGVGTIPHSLENIFAWKYGMHRAVIETTKAFDKWIDPAVPRIALVDYANQEVDDTLVTATELQGKLAGVRVDTCGENVMKGATESVDRPYWFGKGVTVSGVANLRQKITQAGFPDLKIFLSSGFGEVAKVKAFVQAEAELGITLFDSLGVGNLFDARITTMDIVGVGNTIDTIQPVAKVGRIYKPNPRLRITTRV